MLLASVIVLLEKSKEDANWLVPTLAFGGFTV